MRRAGDVLVVSCYELGHQPLAAASAVAFLEREGHRPRVVDLAVESIERLQELVHEVDPGLVLLSVPMHTALHIGVRAAAALRTITPHAHRCFFGLYATLNAEHLLDGIADSVTGGECERTLVELASALDDGRPIHTIDGLWQRGRPARPSLARLDFPPPSRDALPPLARYARLEIDGELRLAAAIEASRGCLHHCRHCPIPPVYGGRFFVIPRDIVLEDIRRLEAAGVRHLTFADPDFLNGPGHSMALVRALHENWPELTFDVTVKIEHVLEHRAKLGELAACGCIFAVSAVESLSDEVLTHLDKGHARADVSEALTLLRNAGIALRPSLVAFTPWTSIADYLDVLDWVERENLVQHLDPVQYSIRLLIPPGSPLASLPAMLPHLRGLAPSRFSYMWEHPDPRMDRLHVEVAAIAREAAATEEPVERTFERIRDGAERTAECTHLHRFGPPPERPIPPRLTEPWFC